MQRVRETGRTSKAVATELGINPRTLASWVRADDIERRGQAWVRRVRPHFDFLTDHGFRLDGVSAEHWWAVTVTYRSTVSAVDVSLSSEFQRVELSLVRLVDTVGEIAPINTFLADWLLTLRADPSQQPGRGLDDSSVEAQLAFWAAALREHGADFLDGDFAVLDQLEHLIRDNIRRHHRLAR